MATGDKKTVVMQADRAIPNGVATLDESGVLDSLQWPDIDNFGAADRILSNLTDPAQALSNIGAQLPIYKSSADLKAYSSILEFCLSNISAQTPLIVVPFAGSSGLDDAPTSHWGQLVISGSNVGNGISVQFIANTSLSATNGLTIMHREINGSGEWETDDWKTIATTDYAVNKAGGDTIETDLFLRGGYNRLTGSGTEMQLESRNTIGSTANRRLLLLRNSDGSDLATALRMVDVVDNVSKGYDFFHTGNKPSGSYTGNGDATERTIETGGIGKMVLVTSGGSTMALVTNQGVMWTNNQKVFNYDLDSVAKLTTDCNIVLTTDGALNINGRIYNYQVL